MSEAVDKPKVPKLRFPEFEGEWAREYLKSFFVAYNEKSRVQDEYEVLTSARRGLIRQAEYYANNPITDRDNIGFNVIPPGYLTYRSRSDDRRFYFNENRLDITGIISVYYPVFKIVDGDNQFFRHLFQRHIDYLGKFSVGTSQTVLSFNELGRIRLRLPKTEEQAKVASFLSAIEQKERLLEEKRGALAAYKRGMMQRLFSQELRFTRNDGSSFPDWQEKRLRELGTFVGGGTPDTSNGAFWNGNVPWISSSDVVDGSIRKLSISRFISVEAIKESAAKLVPAGSLAIVSRVGVGKLAVLPCDVCTSQDFCNFVPNKGVGAFFAFWMQATPKVLLRLCQGTAIKGLTFVELQILRVPFPHPDEQQKIADFLSALDAKIDAIARQIDAMQRFKKGLLQQMFV